MFAAKRVGQLFGVFFLVQFAIGVYVNFSVMPLLLGNPGFLETGAEFSTKIGASALLALIIGSLNIVIAAVSYRIFNNSHPVLTVMLLVLSAVNLSVSVFEYAQVMEMVSYSQQYVAATSESLKILLQDMKPVLSAGRNWAHFFGVTFSGLFLLTFYVLLLRGATLPRLISAIAVVAALIQITAVTQPFFGNSVPMQLLMPIAIAQILMPFIFMYKGIKAKSDE